MRSLEASEIVLRHLEDAAAAAELRAEIERMRASGELAQIIARMRLE